MIKNNPYPESVSEGTIGVLGGEGLLGIVMGLCLPPDLRALGRILSLVALLVPERCLRTLTSEVPEGDSTRLYSSSRNGELGKGIIGERACI